MTYVGNQVIIDGPSGHSVLTGFERYVFTDGTVDNNDGNALVDDLFYYAHNHDVWNAHVDADAHYNAIGWHEGRDPNAFFSTSLYLAVNADVKAAGRQSAGAFPRERMAEGRHALARHSTSRQYLRANPDVAAAHIDPLAHFLQLGAGEGRQPIALDRLTASRTASTTSITWRTIPTSRRPDVDPFQHFQQFGWKEGRNPNALFDTKGYLATYTDVAAAGINPLDHYNDFGWHEGRDPSVNFDTTRISRPIPMSRPRRSIRWCISSSSAWPRAVRPSPTACGDSPFRASAAAVNPLILNTFRGRLGVPDRAIGMVDASLTQASRLRFVSRSQRGSRALSRLADPQKFIRQTPAATR